MGGRTWANIERRYQCRGLTGGAMHDEIIRGAQKSNATQHGCDARRFDGLYYSDANTPGNQIGQVTVEIPFNRLYKTPPAPLIHSLRRPACALAPGGCGFLDRGTGGSDGTRTRGLRRDRPAL